MRSKKLSSFSRRVIPQLFSKAIDFISASEATETYTGALSGLRYFNQRSTKGKTYKRVIRLGGQATTMMTIAS